MKKCGVSTVITDKNRMKNLVLLVGFTACIAITGCKKENSKTLNDQDMIGQIFIAGMSWNTQVKSLLSTIPINIQVDNTIAGPEGGNIHVIGSVTGSMTIDDQTGAILGGIMQLGLTETINSYAFISNDKTYTMNGAPYISLTGTFTLQPGGVLFGTASSMQIGGGVRVTGPDGFDQTINIQITIIINSTGTGGTVSGTIGGRSINYSF